MISAYPAHSPQLRNIGKIIEGEESEVIVEPYQFRPQSLVGSLTAST